MPDGTAEHSDFIPRGDYSRMREDLDQKFGGLGIHVEKDSKTDRLRVVVHVAGKEHRGQPVARRQ